MIPAILERSGTGGWRICWYVLGSMAIASAVLCLAWLRNRPEEMGIAPLGETDLERQARNVGRSSGQRSLGPLFRSAVLWHLAGVYFAFGFSYIIYSTFFIRHLTGEGGLTAGEAGLIWLRVGLISVASGFVWGAFSDRWGRRKALLCVFAIQSISFLAMGLGRCGAWVEVSAGLFAVSAWSVPALMAALAGDMFGARLAPAALGLLTIVFGLGQTTGPYVAGRMADTLHSLAPAFVLAGLVALILGMGGTLALALHREST
jgi:predicted MFS family arabinose efflux permease